MAIHYDPKTKRFRDEKGRLVARDRAMRSSIARKEYEKAQAKAKPKRKPAPPPPPPPPPPKPKPKRKPKPAPPPPPPVSPAKPKAKPKAKKGPRIPPWEHEGIVKEYPDPDEWFPEIDFYGYDDLIEDWGDYDDEETDS